MSSEKKPRPKAGGKKKGKRVTFGSPGGDALGGRDAFMAGLRQQSLADAMKAEAEAAALEAAEADAKRELRRLEQQVNRGDPLNPSQLTKLEQLTQQLEGTDAGDEPEEVREPVEEMPGTIAGMLRKLVEVHTASDLFFLLTLFLALVGALVLVTLPLGSWGFAYALPHRVAHFFAVGGVSGELFALITIFLAWRAEKWQSIPALDWREFGYASWFVYGWAALFGAIGVWMWASAELELRNHGHGTLGSMATREGGFGVMRHPQYLSLPVMICGVGLYMDSRWVVLSLFATLAYCHWVLVPIEENWLKETHPELYAEHIKTVPMWHQYDGGPSHEKRGGGDIGERPGYGDEL